MRLLVKFRERDVRDPQEEAAMLGHRMKSITHLLTLLKSNQLGYAFKSEDDLQTFVLVESDSLESADRLIKTDPLLPYAHVSVTPLVSSAELVRELQDYLGEIILTEKELADLAPRPFDIDPDGIYFMAVKMLKPFSPLLTEAQQREIHRRTVISQRLHHSPIEMADDNPVAEPVGILIVRADSLLAVRQHVSSAPIYPDTVVEISRLHTLEQAMAATEERFSQLVAVAA